MISDNSCFVFCLYSSPDPNGRLRYCQHFVSVICTLYTFDFILLQNHWANWIQKIGMFIWRSSLTKNCMICFLDQKSPKEHDCPLSMVVWWFKSEIQDDRHCRVRNFGTNINIVLSSFYNDPGSVKRKTIKLVFCCSAKHPPLKNKNHYWSTRNRDNVPEWSGISICGLLLQWACTIAC